MGRGKGRAKGIDVTKHFFQSSDAPDRILVQVAPSNNFYMKEEDLSPTQGSEAAFAFKRDGRVEGAMKLCQSWKQGTCYSYTACNNAHVVGGFSGPPAQQQVVGGASNASSTVGGLLQRTREEVGYSTLQHHTNINHHNQHQQHNNNNNNNTNNIQSSTASVECNRMAESKGSAVGTHSTLIPAPRSQQVNRQASLGGSSATANSPSASTAWSRSGATNSSSQHGVYHHHHNNQQQQHHQQRQLPQHQRHHNHQHNQHLQQQQQQQRQQSHHQHGTSQNGGWVTNHKSFDDTIWAFSNDGVGDMLMGTTTPRQLGATDRGVADTPLVSVHSNSRTSNTGDGSHFAHSDNNDGVFCSDVWLANSLGKSPVSAAIWGDVGAGGWDIPSSGGVTTHLPAVGPRKGTKEEISIFATHNTATNGSVPQSGGELWGTFAPNAGESAVDGSVVSGVPSSSEALKNQLLRELVGAGSETEDYFTADTQLKECASSSTGMNTRLSPLFSMGKGLSEQLGNFGCGDVADCDFYGRGKTTGGVPSMPVRSADTIQHLMSLLTTE